MASSSSTNTLNIAADMRKEILSLLANSMASLSNASHEELYIYISPSMNSSETSLHVGGSNTVAGGGEGGGQNSEEQQNVLQVLKNDWAKKEGKIVEWKKVLRRELILMCVNFSGESTRQNVFWPSYDVTTRSIKMIQEKNTVSKTKQKAKYKNTLKI